MRNLPITAIFILLLLSLAGCSMPQNRLIVIDDPGQAVTEKMDLAITRYIESRVAHRNHPGQGSRSFAAQDYYGMEVKETGEVYVYLWTYFQEYYRQEGELLQGGGGSFPLVVTLWMEGDDKVFIEGHQTPEKGSDYGLSIDRLFPQEYHDKIFSRTNVHDLEPLVRQRAEAYFSREERELLTEEELAYFLGEEYNLVYKEDLGQGILLFMEQGGYLLAGFLEDTGDEDYGINQTGWVYLKRGGSDSVSFYGWDSTHLTYIVATNPRVKNVLVGEEPARLIKGKGSLEFWVAFTEGPVEEKEIRALDTGGNIIPLLSYEHIQVPEEEKKVDVRIQMMGRSSLGGWASYSMYRTYINETGVPLYFEDTFSYHSPIHISSVLEGLSIEENFEYGGYHYTISGEVLPFEPLTISMTFQGRAYNIGKSGSSWSEGESLRLFNRGENTRLNYLYVSHGFPPGATKQMSELILSSFGGTKLEIEPDVFQELLSVTWSLADKEKPTQAGGRSAGEIIDLAEQDYVYLSLRYLARVNSLPHYLTYLALALSAISLIFAFLLAKRMKEKQSG